MRKKSKILPILAVILILALAAGTAYFYLQFQDTSEIAREKIAELEANRQVEYVALTDISAGEKIEAGVNVELQTIATGLEDFYYMTEDQLNGVAKIDISAGTPMLSSMVAVTSITDDSRYVELAAVTLQTSQEEYDVVDVRISFPDGSDYLVLSKKTMRNLILEKNIFSCILNEEEILRYTCAMVDAYTQDGARLYTTTYVESTLQKDAEPTYPVSEAVMELIETDPNVTTRASYTLNMSARQNLVNRLAMLSNEYTGLVDSALSAQDAAISSENEGAQDAQNTEDDLYFEEENTINE